MTWLGPHHKPRVKDHPMTCHSPILSLFLPGFGGLIPHIERSQGANTISELNETRSRIWSTAQWDARVSPAAFPVYPQCTGVLIAFGRISPDWAGPKPQSLCTVTHTRRDPGVHFGSGPATEETFPRSWLDIESSLSWLIEHGLRWAAHLDPWSHGGCRETRMSG